MVLADDPAELPQFGGLVVVRPDLPHDVAGGLLDDQNDVGVAAVDDEVVGMETLVARVVPLVRAEHGHGIGVDPVARDVAVAEPGVVVGIAVHEVARDGVEAQFLKMIGHFPFPDDVAVPVHFVDHVVEQELVGNFGHADVLVREDQRVAAVGLGFHAGHVIAHGVAFALIVVVLAGHPLGFLARVLDVFGLVELPDDVAVPVHLHEVGLVLKAVFGIAFAKAAHDVAAGEHLVREALQTFPHPHFIAVHVDEQSAAFGGLKDGVTAPAFFGVINGYAGGKNRRAHQDTPSAWVASACPFGQRAGKTSIAYSTERPLFGLERSAPLIYGLG